MNNKFKAAILALGLGLGMSATVSAATEAECNTHEFNCYVYGINFSCKYIAKFCMQ
ncbi:MAG: hypothetical protein HRT35_06905 [Algicola sp.]|nr:hypothetical protein [Algicola sp.]